MIFVEKPDSPGLDYPHAFGRFGAMAAYPISGEYATNPDYYSREVIKSRTAQRAPTRTTHFDPTFPDPREGFNIHQQRICRWIAQYWHLILDTPQRMDWATLQNTAQYSIHPPISWRGSWWRSHGWALFFMHNKCSALQQQPFNNPVDYTRPMPRALAPSSWEPFYNLTLTVTLKLSAPFSSFNLTATPYASKWITMYSSKPGRQVGPFGPPRMLQFWTATFPPGVNIVPWHDWNRAFPNAKAGQFVTIGARAIRTSTLSPSNLATFTTTVQP